MAPGGSGHRITVAVRDYSELPGPGLRSQGPFSGEEFRETVLEPKFAEARRAGGKLFVDLDGAFGCGRSFLEEAFGGLARQHGEQDVVGMLELKSDEDPYQIDDIKRYIRNAVGKTKSAGSASSYY